MRDVWKRNKMERLVLTTTFLGVERKISAKLPLDFSNCGSMIEIEEKIKRRILNKKETAC